MSRPRHRVYLSSTIDDLRRHRKDVIAHIDGLPWAEVVCEERYPGDGFRSTKQRCQDDVRAADIYLGLFGFRYGESPDGELTSFTELELEAAVESGKPLLLFVLSERAKVRYSDVDRQNAAKVEELRRRVRELDATPVEFRTRKELLQRVAWTFAHYGETWTPAVRGGIERDDLRRYLTSLGDGFDGKRSPALEATVEVLTVREVWGRGTVLGRAVEALRDPKRPRVLLLGRLGSGRSTLVRHLALRLVAEARASTASVRHRHIPVFVQLAGVPAHSFEGCLSDALSGIEVADLLGHLDAGGLATVLVDGLSNVVDAGRRAEIERGIAAFARDRPGLRVVVTGGLGGHRNDGVFRRAGFSVLGVEDLDSRRAAELTAEELRSGRTEEFVRRWFAATEPDPRLADSRAEALLNALDAPNLRPFARSPLLLSLVAMGPPDVPLTGQRHKLVERALPVLLDDAAGPADAGEPRLIRDVGHDDRVQLVVEIALAMSLPQDGSRSVTEFRWSARAPEKIILDPIWRFANHRFPREPERAVNELRSLLLDEPSFLLVENPRGTYRFAVPLFQDYFTARALHSTIKTERHRLESVSNLAVDHGLELPWRGVLSMLAAQLSPLLAGTMIDRLVRVDDAAPAEGDGRALSTAVHCLAEIADPSTTEVAGEVAAAATRVLDALVLRIERAVLGPDPTLWTFFDRNRDLLEAIGSNWPNTGALLTWYRQRGARIVEETAAQLATRLTATLCSAHAEQVAALVDALTAAIDDGPAAQVIIERVVDLLDDDADPALCAAVAEHARDTDRPPQVRRMLVGALARPDHPALADQVLSALLERVDQDSDGEVVQAAADQAWRRGRDDEAARPRLLALLERRARDRNVELRRAALEKLFEWSGARATRALGDEPTADTVDLWLMHDLPVDDVPTDVLERTARTARHSLARWEALRQVLRREPASTRKVALLDRLVRHDRDRGMFRRAAKELAALDADRLALALRARLETEVGDVDAFVATARVLDQADPRWVDEEVIPRIAQPGEVRWRRTAFEAVIAIRRDVAVIDLALDLAAADDDLEILRSALGVLNQGRRLEAALADELRHRKWDRRFRAALIEVHGRRGPDDPELDDMMPKPPGVSSQAAPLDPVRIELVAVRHSNPARRLEALRWLFMVAESEDPAIAPHDIEVTVLDRLRLDDSPDVVEAAGTFARRHGFTPAAGLLRSRAVEPEPQGDDALPSERERAADLCARAATLLRGADPTAWRVLPLLRAVRDSVPDDFSAPEKVVRLAGAGAPAALRLAAADVLLRWGVEAERARQVVLELLAERNAAVLDRVLELAARLPAAGPRVGDRLAAIAVDDRLPAEQRQRALLALSCIGGDDVARLGKLCVDRAVVDPDTGVRAVAVHLFTRTRGAGQGDLPELTGQELLRPDPGVFERVQAFLAAVLPTQPARRPAPPAEEAL